MPDIHPRSLLDQARALNNRRPKQGYEVTDEHVELALAWLRHEVTFAQIAAVIYPEKPKFDNRVYARMVSWVRAAYESGRITIR